MDQYFKTVTLPAPSADLVSAINELVADQVITQTFLVEREKMLTDNPGANLASVTGSNSPAFVQLAKAQYDQYFPNDHVGYSVVLCRNNNPGTPAIHAPHGDRLRLGAIHYVISNGGDNCTVTLYEKLATFQNPNLECVPANDPSLGASLTTYKNNIGDWFGFDCRHYHYVQNIDTDLVYLALSFNGSNIDDLTTKYSSLFAS